MNGSQLLVRETEKFEAEISARIYHKKSGSQIRFKVLGLRFSPIRESY